MGMTSVREIYKIGRGPSSSHTIGPERACRVFREKHPEADAFRVVLYGSLARTGEGHGTGRVIEKTFAPLPVTVEWDTVTTDLPHPNTMDLFAYRAGAECGRMRAMSVGGGNIVLDKPYLPAPEERYAEASFDDIRAVCEAQGLRLCAYVFRQEGDGFSDYLQTVWEAMQEAIGRGLGDEGVLPGGLQVQKKAKMLYAAATDGPLPENSADRYICAYAFAVSEQNANGGRVVTAPTCGAAGVLPAVLYHYQRTRGFSDADIRRALATAGLVGDLIKTNASISGAECGCQAEIGSACAMAAAALGELLDMEIEKIEYAAEIAIEHHLGLTCDPIGGLVQIPCIERNAVAALRAVHAVELAGFLWNTRRISLDRVIRTMKETGQDLPAPYRETSLGGLAKIKL